MIDEMRLVVQFAVGLVFLLSVSSKLMNPREFARGVKEYQILPAYLTSSVALLLIPLEAFLAVSHLTGWLLKFAVPAGLLTLASFATAVSVNLRRGRALRCYCFDSGETISVLTLVRLILLVAGEVLLLTDPSLFMMSRLVYPHQISSLSQIGLGLFWAVFFLVAGFWLLSVSDMMELLRSCRTCGGEVPTNSGSAQRQPNRHSNSSPPLE